ncbi:MAG: hypothetical protein DRH70_09635 [Candidatus Coatesbacteria bacterium]|nr:MAG: hypothetical protein DRH70_09635 [Candidatus Coatesbacteria bacterium]
MLKRLARPFSCDSHEQRSVRRTANGPKRPIARPKRAPEARWGFRSEQSLPSSAERKGRPRAASR